MARKSQANAEAFRARLSAFYGSQLEEDEELIKAFKDHQKEN